MIHVYRSNRLETLADLFCRDIERQGDSIFEDAFNVVQSQGMARWLTLYQAKERGIAFNPTYLYPRNAILRLMDLVWADDPQPPFPAQEEIVWPIYELLTEMKSLPGFEAVAAYLDDENSLKQLQLSMKLAGLFDDYLVYRYNWIQQWVLGNGEGLPWQGQLFRALWQKLGMPTHLAIKVNEAKKPLPEDAKLPKKIRLFGLSTLPPLYLQFLDWISQKIPVDLYLLQPTAGYWGDILSPKQRAGLNENEEEFFFAGHPLLGSMGIQGRDFLNLLIDAGASFIDQEDLFEFQKGSLLKNLQADLLNFGEDEGRLFEDNAWPIDSTIQIHNCHSPMREVEVLKDSLLQAFSDDPNLKPEDILVLTSDIEAYAPYIHAVFARDENPIPYSIADQSSRVESDMIGTFFRTLELVGTPHTTTAVYEWLKQPIIACKYAFSESDYALMKRWIQEVGIRWGRDAEHRQSLSGVAFEQNTWAQGFKKLLLGVAMQGDQISLYEKMLPYHDMEGQVIELLGRMLDALTWLFDLTTSFEHPRSLQQWRRDLFQAIHNLWDSNNVDLSSRNALEQCLGHLGKYADVPGVDIQSLRCFLTRTVESHYQSGRFLQGKVSFASLKPLRSVPAKVICLLGMGFDEFPHVDRPYEFNEMAKNPRLGDRRVRDSDRYLFLEILLSARDRLFISYVGQSPKDNAKSPPSVLVSELLDYLHSKLGVADVKDSPLCINHKLYPFHPDYFESQVYFTYSQSAESIAQKYRQLLNGEVINQYSAPADLSEVHFASGWPETILSMQDLISFLKHPLKAFLTRTAKLRFPRKEETFEEIEPFGFNNLEAYNAKNRLFQLRLKGVEPDQIKLAFQAEGLLPLGGHGDALFQSIEKEISPLLNALNDYQINEGKRELSGHLDLADKRYLFAFNHIYGSKVLTFRPAKAKSKDYLEAWISHLTLLAAGKSDLDLVYLTLDKQICFDRSMDAEKLLKHLIDLFYEGHRKPLYFFPNSSKAYIDQKKKLEKKHTLKETSIDQALKQWNGDWNNRYSSEKADPEYTFYFRDFSPWEDPEWVEFLDSLAEQIWTPLLNALNEEALL